ncbi:MAG TPA: hypothetical protein VFN87_03865 [Solirubrobacteraceae bacterium]|nr:hypothetical protein [Solirubrobacteraceae bacterium]
MTLAALAAAAVAVAVIAVIYGVGHFADAWSHLHVGWLGVAFAAELLAIPAYAFAYRELARFDDGPLLPAVLVARLVMLGFGPLATRGGFAIDRRALGALEGDAERGSWRVVGLGALEWALLSPAAWLAAIVLLISGDPRPMPSLLWPWIILVPVGFGVVLWLAQPGHRDRLCARGGPRRRAVRRGLEGVWLLIPLARRVRRTWPAWLGAGLYWALEIAVLYSAVRFIGLGANVGEIVLAFATGYALTRRSMPLGGAAITEVLMTFALHWVGQPVAGALAAVVVYRCLNFLLPAIPALVILPRIEPLLVAAEEDRVPAPHHRRRAAAPLGQS